MSNLRAKYRVEYQPIGKVEQVLVSTYAAHETPVYRVYERWTNGHLVLNVSTPDKIEAERVATLLRATPPSIGHGREYDLYDEYPCRIK